MLAAAGPAVSDAADAPVLSAPFGSGDNLLAMQVGCTLKGHDFRVVYRTAHILDDLKEHSVAQSLHLNFLRDIFILQKRVDELKKLYKVRYSSLPAMQRSHEHACDAQSSAAQYAC